MVSHMIGFRKLGRATAHRLAMLRTMTTQLLEHEKIVTTVEKAKEVRRQADKMITCGKKPHMLNKVEIRSFVRTNEMVSKVLTTLPERYADREGGYTRIKRLGTRLGDGASMCSLELVQESVAESRKNKEFKMLLKKERNFLKDQFLTVHTPNDPKFLYR